MMPQRKEQIPLSLWVVGNEACFGVNPLIPSPSLFRPATHAHNTALRTHTQTQTQTLTLPLTFTHASTRALTPAYAFYPAHCRACASPDSEARRKRGSRLEHDNTLPVHHWPPRLDLGSESDARAAVPGLMQPGPPQQQRTTPTWTALFHSAAHTTQLKSHRLYELPLFSAIATLYT
ncbi:hypothetical protein VTK73DRAFT_2265 [Phialemonium thermophilum]|uniref:Uncharacterized protein n=1 Tax=Phialemonium thermophilum TaxID=223376 RepID=A0ABR3VSD5_9PEZI